MLKHNFEYISKVDTILAHDAGGKYKDEYVLKIGITVNRPTLYA